MFLWISQISKFQQSIIICCVISDNDFKKRLELLMVCWDKTMLVQVCMQTCFNNPAQKF